MGLADIDGQNFPSVAIAKCLRQGISRTLAVNPRVENTRPQQAVRILRKKGLKRCRSGLVVSDMAYDFHAKSKRSGGSAEAAMRVPGGFYPVRGMK